MFGKPLCHTFNVCLKSSDILHVWKTSKECPVFKKGEKSEITNYRPIAIIC